MDDVAKNRGSGKGKKPEELDGVPECGSTGRVVPRAQEKVRRVADRS